MFISSFIFIFADLWACEDRWFIGFHVIGIDAGTHVYFWVGIGYVATCFEIVFIQIVI